MVNYYKILEIENYASIEVVRAAYKDKIRMYHPDINPDPEAAEITKYLNQAKERLTDPVKKEQYDRELKIAYLIEIRKLANNPPKNQWRSMSISERRKKMADKQKLKAKEGYLKGLSLFPLVYRFALLGLIILSGLVIIYNNYFVTLSGNENYYMLLGFLLFLVGLVITTNQSYKYYWIKSLDVAIRFNYERWISRLLVLLFFLGPLSIYGLNEIRKSYHLENNSEYVLGRIHGAETGMDYVVFSYEIDGQLYKKGVYADYNDLIIMYDNYLVIQYATVDPRIADVVTKDDQPKFKRRL